jgi:CDP-diglyceride synthetase
VWFDFSMLGLLAVGATVLIGTFRGAMVALSAVLLVLLMDTGGWVGARRFGRRRAGSVGLGRAGRKRTSLEL